MTTTTTTLTAKLIPQIASLLSKWPSATSYAERLSLLKAFADGAGIAIDTMPDSTSSLQRRPRFVADETSRQATLVLLAAVGSKLSSNHADELRKQASDMTYNYKSDREHYARVDRNWGRLANVPHWVLVPASTKASRSATIESRGDSDWASILGASFGLNADGSPVVTSVTPEPVTSVTPEPVTSVTPEPVTSVTPPTDDDLPVPPKRGRK